MAINHELLDDLTVLPFFLSGAHDANPLAQKILASTLSRHDRLALVERLHLGALEDSLRFQLEKALVRNP